MMNLLVKDLIHGCVLALLVLASFLLFNHWESGRERPRPQPEVTQHRPATDTVRYVPSVPGSITETPIFSVDERGGITFHQGEKYSTVFQHGTSSVTLSVQDSFSRIIFATTDGRMKP